MFAKKLRMSHNSSLKGHCKPFKSSKRPREEKLTFMKPVQTVINQYDILNVRLPDKFYFRPLILLLGFSFFFVNPSVPKLERN